VTTGLVRDAIECLYAPQQEVQSRYDGLEADLAVARGRTGTIATPTIVRLNGSPRRSRRTGRKT